MLCREDRRAKRIRQVCRLFVGLSEHEATHMISSRDVAERVSALMLEVGAKLDASVADVEASCPKSEVSDYRRAVGKMMGAMLLDVMNPLYAAHPSLKPKDLRLFRIPCG